MKLDIEKYLPYLDDPDMSRDEKIEVIEAVADIVQRFVEIGWGGSTLRSSP